MLRRLGAFAAAIAAVGLIPLSAGAQSCVGTTCDLGGQFRLQIGQGLPLPITLNPAPTGKITSAVGGVQAIPGATIMQTLGPAPRRLTLAPGQMTYDGPAIQIPVVGLNPAVLAVSTNLDFSFPAASLPVAGRPVGSVNFSQGGRPGADVVSHCIDPGLVFAPPAAATFDPGCINANATALGAAPIAHGFARYTATGNQFGGNALAKTTGGTARVFFNAASLTADQLPCTGGPGCFVAIQLVTPPATQAGGASFLTPPNATPAINNPTGIVTANIGAAGTVLALGNPLTGNGDPLPFAGQDATSWGLPWTTGRLSQTNTVVPPGAATSMFVRTGADGRNENGSGLVTMVGGTISTRSLSLSNANRWWVTLQVPEPGALLGSGAAFAALFGLHQIMGRRKRDSA